MGTEGDYRRNDLRRKLWPVGKSRVSGIEQLDRGDGIPGAKAFAELKYRRPQRGRNLDRLLKREAAMRRKTQCQRPTSSIGFDVECQFL